MIGVAAVLSAISLLTACGNGDAVSDKPGEGTTVRVGVASWTSAQPVAAVFTALLQDLGYSIDGPTEFASNPILYQAIDQGDLDFWANGWFPLHEPQLPADFNAHASIFAPHCPACGLQGYLVNASAIDEFNITSLMDFTRDEVKAAFDADGDGKADLFGCPPGWGCHDVINYHLESLGLTEHINHVSASYPANFADAEGRIRSGQNALYYTWTPNDTILALVPGEDVTWINLVDDASDLTLAPSQSAFETSALTATGLAGAVSDPINLGFVAADIHVVANNEFVDSHPAAAKLFEEVRLPLSWISEATLAISENDEDPNDLAEKFIEDNKDLTDEWLQTARDAEEE